MHTKSSDVLANGDTGHRSWALFVHEIGKDVQFWDKRTAECECGLSSATNAKRRMSFLSRTECPAVDSTVSLRNRTVDRPVARCPDAYRTLRSIMRLNALQRRNETSETFPGRILWR
ncbi:hypothetical protein ACLKA7_003541 [Drosophila subpalustris]